MIAMLLAAAIASPPADLPVVTVDHDNVRIDRSCRVVIPNGVNIDDADGNGVVQIVASDITVRFEAGSVLRGSPGAPAPDAYRGVGVRIQGCSGVTLVGASISGFKAGVWATACPGLTVAECSFDDLWRQRLKSTPAAEDQSDWLWPHRNDANEWLTNYGAAVYLEDGDRATVRGVRVRRGQNGVILDRVNHAKVYDNDCSFLSGWGLAMWRSSDNTISRNALDFCIRGYSHGVYNRGQDSAGILCFEQCSRNAFVENSMTHGGDGFFGFAGREALGEDPATAAGFSYVGRGCNENVFLGNDCSYAAAHGIELTFSFGNRMHANRLVGNAICGVWGGYSQRTTIDSNEVADNGLKGQREGGGINIEHGYENAVIGNTFRGNTVGVALWGGDSGGLAQREWYRANHKGSDANHIERNTFEGDGTAVRLRRCGTTALGGNTFSAVGKQVDAEADCKIAEVADAAKESVAPAVAAIGETRPVGSRRDLAGRQQIIVTEWGPWDHRSPLVRSVSQSGAVHELQMFQMPEGSGIEVTNADGSEPKGFTAQVEPAKEGRPVTMRIIATEPGVHSYRLAISGPYRFSTAGTLVSTRWKGRVFASEVDPRESLDAWRKQADKGIAFECDTVDWALGYGGPSKIKSLGEAVAAAKIPGKNYGIIASAAVPLPAGTWRIRTLSDDGVRVRATTGGGIGGEAETRTIIENWTHHGPTGDSGELVVSAGQAGVVMLEVEYFQLDGYAVLKLDIEPVK